MSHQFTRISSSFLLLSLLFVTTILISTSSSIYIKNFSVSAAASPEAFTRRISTTLSSPARELSSCVRNVAQTHMWCGTFESTARAHRILLDPITREASSSAGAGGCSPGKFQSVSLDDNSNLLYALCYRTSADATLTKFGATSMSVSGNTLGLGFTVNIYGSVMVDEGYFAYIVDGSSTSAKIYRVTKSDGTIHSVTILSSIGTTPTTSASLAISMDNTSLFVAMIASPGKVGKINIANNSFTQVGNTVLTLNSGENFKANAFQENMICDQVYLYVCASDTGWVVKIRQSDMSRLAAVDTVVTDQMSITIHPLLNLLFTSCPTDSKIKAVKINSSTDQFENAADDVVATTRPYARPVATSWYRVYTADYTTNDFYMSCFDWDGSTMLFCNPPSTTPAPTTFISSTTTTSTSTTTTSTTTTTTTTTSTTTTTTTTPAPTSNDEPIGGGGGSSGISSSSSSSGGLSSETIGIIGGVVGGTVGAVILVLVIYKVTNYYLGSNNSSGGGGESFSRHKTTSTTKSHQAKKSVTNQQDDSKSMRRRRQTRQSQENDGETIQQEETQEYDSNNLADENEGTQYFEGEDGFHYCFNGEEYFFYSEEINEWLPLKAVVVNS